MRSIILAQNEILNNLNDSEQKFQELNQRLNMIKTEYQNLQAPPEPMSFFNFSNIYFWLVVCGLFLILFALWFLYLELKIKRIDLAREEIREVKKKVIEPAVQKAEKKVHKVLKVPVKKVK